MRRYLRFGVLAAVILIVAACEMRSRTAKKMSKAPTGNVPEGVTVGKRAPDITGEDADGVKFKLSDYRGKVVLLDFWFET